MKTSDHEALLRRQQRSTRTLSGFGLSAFGFRLSALGFGLWALGFARDHRKLRVFHDAHRLTLAIYKHTKNFPKEEWYGLRAQIRKASTSIPTNIVEGSARRTTRAYLNFLNVARASAAEVTYLVLLTFQLEMLSKGSFAILDQLCQQLVPQLEALVDSVEKLWSEERKGKRAKVVRIHAKVRNGYPSKTKA
jgi:four helix bundle protein